MGEPILKYIYFPKIIERTDLSVNSCYTQLKEYLITFHGNITSLTNDLQKIDQDFETTIREHEAEIKKNNNNLGSTPLGYQFAHEIGKLITQTRAFNFATHVFPGQTVKYIDELIQQYHFRSLQLIQGFQEVIQAFNDLVSQDDKKQQAYKKAAEAYIQAKSTGKNLKKAKAEHARTKQIAIDSHEQRVIEAAKTSLRFDSLITEFEELEKYRQFQNQKILNEFSSSLVEVGNHFAAGKTQLLESIRSIEPERTKENQATSFKPIVANDQFQTFQLPPAVTLLLPPSTIYPSEILQGRRIVQVTQDYHVSQLDVIKGELLMAELEEDQNGFVKCQNINESVGLLPSSILQTVQ